MEARRRVPARAALVLVLLFLVHATFARPLPAASVQTANFVVDAPSPQLAAQLGEAAEAFRKSLAVEWLGHELPRWDERCPIRATIQRGAGGATSFYFTRGRVHGWKMDIQGSPERMLDSVLPHEVTHTIFATHFGCALPRWADEGACTTVEHPGEIARMEGELIKFLKTRRGIRFSDMMWIKEYPRDFMPLYAQGHSVAAYLIGLKGKQAFVRFLEDGLTDDNWPRAVKRHYGYVNLGEMQNQWLGWVRAGRPALAKDGTGPAVLVSDTRPIQSGRETLAPQDQTTSAVARSAAAGGETQPSTSLAASLAASPPATTSVASRLPAPITSHPIARSPRESLAPVRASAHDASQDSSRERVVFQWSAPTPQ